VSTFFARVQTPSSPSAASIALGRAASLALYDELALSPKPGLVTFEDSGSHDDMDARTFMRSIHALRSYFPLMAELGAQRAPFALLPRCGIEAEARMMAATGDINTHRGAIFTLGLLCAAAGATLSAHQPLTAFALREALLERWGESLLARACQPPRMPGGVAAWRLGLRSASAEAALGFPVLFEMTLPTLRARLQETSEEAARVDALFATIAVLEDSNLARRAGLEGLHFAHERARDFLDAGGFATRRGPERAARIGREFVERRLSPGGAADMLAAACFVQRVCGPNEAA
jgi:triphosphoribosyl-dephospho-CoA synthase